MRKHILAVAFAAALAAGCLGVAGCAPAAGNSVNANVPEGAPSLMPAGHAGRFETLGASGCYGCHGVNGEGKQLLATAAALPEDHYKNGTWTSMIIDPVREQCNTCHGQG